MITETILEMQHICKTYPGVVALDDVDLRLSAGEVHVLLGENGAGKSTLIKIISGAVPRTGGTITIGANSLENFSPRQAMATGVATIYQELNLVLELTVAENIYLGREPISYLGFIDANKIKIDAEKVLTDLGIDIDPSTKVSALGMAQKQMVEIAKAISMQMKILILDEPTSALTNREIEQLFTVIRSLKERGKGIIYISHRLEEIFEIGDCVTVLRDGKVVSHQVLENVDIPELIHLMANRKLDGFYPREKCEIGDEILRVEHLSRDNILHDINFRLNRGEILGITGLMGSGRTELARVLFGADQMDSGQIFINNIEEKIDSPRRAIEKKIGFLSEDRKLQGLVLKMSLENNINLPILNQMSKLGIIQIETEHRLAEKHIKNLQIKTTGPLQVVESLSGGNQQKVVIAKWLACCSDIFIFDEPTRGIDVAAKVEIYQLMNALTARGAAIVMISSELPEILGMSDRILVMKNGKISGEFNPNNCTQEMLLEAALGVNHAES